jgi:hypothetical protein
LHHSAHEFLYLFIFQLKREQRWHCLFDGNIRSAQQICRGAAAGENYCIWLYSAATFVLSKRNRQIGINRRDFAAAFYVDSSLVHGSFKCVHYLHGVLAAREYTLIFLLDEPDTQIFEPIHAIRLAEFVKQTLHEPETSGVDFLQRLDVPESIGQIASPASGDGKLCHWACIGL